MWILYAFASAFFAGLTAILSKVGMRNINSNAATAIRTIVVFIFSWIIVFLCGSQGDIGKIGMKTLIFLILSGASTGASWLCYFKALQLGNVNKVAPIDKSSTILSMILAIIFFGEKLSFQKGICIILMAFGTYLMIDKKKKEKSDNNSWLLWALLSALLASMTTIFVKIGINDIDSNLGTAIRTIVVLIMSWIVVFVTNNQQDIKKIDKKNICFIILSGVSTGLSWLAYYKALKDGIVSIVIPIDKLSILVTILFSYIMLKEKFTKKYVIGLALLVSGTLLLLV